MENKIIFMGSGNYSLAECYKLHQKLEMALTLLGGIQQPPHSESKEHAEQFEHFRVEWTQDIENIAKEIATALTGKKVELK